MVKIFIVSCYMSHVICILMFYFYTEVYTVCVCVRTGTHLHVDMCTSVCVFSYACVRVN